MKEERNNSEKILEMNQKAKNFRKLLLFLGIFPFVLTAFIPIDIGAYFGCKGTDDKIFLKTIILIQLWTHFVEHFLLC